MRKMLLAISAMLLTCCHCAWSHGQRVQFPSTLPSTSLPGTGNRPIQDPIGGISTPAMVPINPATQAGVYPSPSPGSASFDPYAGGPISTPLLGGPIVGLPNTAPISQGATLGAPSLPPPSVGTGYGNVAPTIPLTPPSVYGGSGYGVAPYGGTGYNGPQPILPGTGQSAIVNTFPNNPAVYGQPGVYPGGSPTALFPGAYPGPQSQPLFGGFFRNLYNGIFGQPGSFTPASPPVAVQPQVIQPGVQGPVLTAPSYNGNWLQGTANWLGGVNPQGYVFGGNQGVQPPGFMKLFQGPRFRHAYIYGDNDTDALAINDSDLSLAFAIPNFLFSAQPLYLLPSFSLHQWDGPHPPATADLPPLAYSAFLDAGWQSDPVRILGAELGLRVGMFSDFETANSDSLRIMGRGIGRVRLTPRATLKAGVIYLDRNKVKLLPAGGLLWQPRVDTRLDIFFPEPKLASYLNTVGTVDTWWYVGGYYGGGAWTIQRDDGTDDSIDINDLRIVVGLEFGRNEFLREGRRNAFVEFGYVFDRELLYDNSPVDNMDLQDTVMVRAGIGY